MRVFLGGLFALGFMIAPAIARDCLGGLRKSLIQGGFSIINNCNPIKGHPVKIGSIFFQKIRFDVYNFSYKVLPSFSGGQIHGNVRLLFFKNGKYIGAYYLDDKVKCKIIGKAIIVDAPGISRSVILVTKVGPPKRAFLDGDDRELSPDG